MNPRNIIRHINILNIILLSIAVFSGYHLYYQACGAKAVYTIPAKEKPTAENPEDPAGENKPVSPLEYTIIADQNLFHPERRIPPEKKPAQELPKPEFVLYGTLMADDAKIAYIEDLKAPRTTPGRGKRQTALRPGQIMSGYKLEEIHNDKVVMTRGEDRIEIKVIQNKNKKQRMTEAPKGNVPVKK